MQKIQSYLYPNRVIVIADLATTGFITEFRNVYTRTIKIYTGVDNTIEFDVKNADQKRVDLTNYTMNLTLIDASGNQLDGNPYRLTKFDQTTQKGLCKVTIPFADIDHLDLQTLTYSITGTDASGNDVLFYTDSAFGALGQIQIAGDAMGKIREDRVYKDFTAEIDLQGLPIWHSSSIPSTFYEAEPTDILNFEISVKNFIGTIWLDATEQGTLAVESFRSAGRPFGSWSSNSLYTGIIPFATSVPVGDYKYFRVSYQSQNSAGQGAVFSITKTGNAYTSISIVKGGTGYNNGATILVPGSQLGGVDGTNDAIVTVSSIATVGSSYSISSVISATVSGTASNGTATYQVTGTNYSGIIDSITVS